jgi:type IV pilus assembly protein PilV
MNTTTTQCISGSRQSHGVGMVEVLVTLVILSVGLLGTATLYVTSMQTKTTAQSRMQAVNLAADIADRIRANRTAGNGYALAEATDLTTAPTASCTTTNCTPAQMAAVDLYLWSAAVLNNNTLPGAVYRRITVTNATPTTPTIYLIRIRWTEPSLGELTHTLEVRI